MIGRFVAALALLCLAACAAPSAPSPAPPSTSSRNGAPPVESPRDIGSIAADPCHTILNAASWQQLGFSPAGVGRTVITGEQSCRWSGPNNSQSISVIVIPGQDVLSAEYRARQFPIFQPTVIAGLPAIREQSTPDAISCTITVGTAEGQGLTADYYAFAPGPSGHRDDPCGQAQRIVEQVVQQLPPLQAK